MDERLLERLLDYLTNAPLPVQVTGGGVAAALLTLYALGVTDERMTGDGGWSQQQAAQGARLEQIESDVDAINAALQELIGRLGVSVPEPAQQSVPSEMQDIQQALHIIMQKVETWEAQRNENNEQGVDGGATAGGGGAGMGGPGTGARERDGGE
jgi:hypothetical protein